MLPWSRPTLTAAPFGGSLLVAVQDYAAAFFGGRRPPQTLTLPAAGVRTGWSLPAGGSFVAAAAVAQRHAIPLHLRPGALVSAIAVSYRRQASMGGVVLALRRSAHDGTSGSVGGGALTGTLSTWLYESVAIGHELAAGYSYWIELSAGAVDDRVDLVTVAYSYRR